MRAMTRLAQKLLKRTRRWPDLLRSLYDSAQAKYLCSAYHQNSALQPIIAQLERAAQSERDDTLQLKLEKLETLLTSISLNGEDIAVLADLLPLPLSSYYPPLNFAPQRKKEKTCAAWLHQLEALARHPPVLVGSRICNGLIRLPASSST